MGDYISTQQLQCLERCLCDCVEVRVYLKPCTLKATVVRAKYLVMKNRAFSFHLFLNCIDLEEKRCSTEENKETLQTDDHQKEFWVCFSFDTDKFQLSLKSKENNCLFIFWLF